MKVVHFSTTDVLGGAAQATYKLHKELINQGIRSHMFVRYSVSPRPYLVTELKRKNTIYENKIKPRIQKYAYKRLQSKYQVAKHIPFSWNLHLPDYNLNISEIEEADIVCLYWIGEFLSPEVISTIKKPIVWRLSDIWPFSGGCHYPGNCTNYKNGCGNCHYFINPKENDYSRELNYKKQELWNSLDITIAAPSRWIADLAGKSNIFKNKKIEIIKTGVDENHFKPIDRNILRRAFNISENKLLILFGADSASDERKGIKYLIDALGLYKKEDRKDIALGIFGGNYHHSIDELGFEIHYFGYVNESFLPIVYNMSNVFIAPSIEENLPNTVLEAMACGIPSVTFNIGGLPDLIEHKKNGCMAIPQNTVDLHECIKYAVKHREELGSEARKTILKEFTQEHQAKSYIQLYKKILNK
jgi:glycosyltransferase involved in cell wall biosynthesis